jgi:uncharacterized protein (DUF1330 family)
MRNRTAVAIALAAGFGLGAASIHTLHAQAKLPAFAVIETDVKDNDRYVKEYAPKAQALTREKGGRVIAASSSVSTLEGAPAKRIAIVQFANMDQLKGWHGSPEFKQNRKHGDQLATFRILAVEGLPQP